MKKYNKVAVISGGFSDEREVSLKSGKSVCSGLIEAGYDVVEIDIQSKEFDVPEDVEAVFIALHGEFGEDGQIQQILEEKNIPYTGTRAAELPVAMDKILSKELLKKHNLPTAAYEVVQGEAYISMPCPLVIKAPLQGSSIGIEIVRDPAEVQAALNRVLEFDQRLLVEEFIPGREFTVGMVNGELLPPVEIIPQESSYDYYAKYESDQTVYECPAALSSEEMSQITELAKKTFNVFKCKGLGRVDFRMTTDGEFYILEINSIPGFTATSLLPKSAKAAGITFSELCNRIMAEAV